MVEVRYSGRLGNQLFQYSLGRILAEGLGYTLHAPPIDGFPRTFERISGKSFAEPAERFTGHSIPIESILLNRAPRRLILDGFFQNYRYYAVHQDRMRAWLSPEPSREPVADIATEDDEHVDDLLVHVRLGDLVALRQALSIDFYQTLLDRIPHRHAYLAAEHLDDPMLTPLLRAGLRPLSSALSAPDILRAANRFGRLITSQATFGWWMAFLGTRIKEVHIGIPEHTLIGSGSMSRIADGLDLRIDEPRYTFYYRAPLIGEKREGQLTCLGNFCGAHARSRAYLWS
jgi:hypothetical protein